jgi:TRAP-type C4-dicarboxylate transport system substrate-binding protein
VSAAIVRALGAEPLPVPAFRLASALRTRVIDESEGTLSALVSTGIDSGTAYFSATEHSRAPGVVVFSKRVWDTLSPADRTIVRAAAKESVTFLREKLRIAEIHARAKAEAAGVTFVDDVDRAAFIDKLTPLRRSLVSDPAQQDLIARIRIPEEAKVPEPANDRTRH